jgi:flagellum-specific peptidoglycan hydrolase FlgJ
MDKAAIDTAIYNQAFSMGIPATVAKIIAAQARYETADYTSNLFKNYNNAFGYKWVGQKKWASGPAFNAPSADAQGNTDGGTYAAYPSVQYSTGELVDWLKRRQNEGKLNIASLTTPDVYAYALKSSGYYGQTASQYGTGILAKLKKIAIDNAGNIATVALLAVAVFF